MGRGRLSMELIRKEKSRRVTFQKRKKGLMKKAYEFSTLCGVDTCVIVYESPSDETAQPETWPPDPAEIRRILERYRYVVGKGKQARKNYDLTEFFRDRKAKMESEMAKVRRETLNLIYPTWDERLEKFGALELKALDSFLGEKVGACERRMKRMKETEPQVEDDSMDFLQASSQLKLPPFDDMKLCEDQLVPPSFLSPCTNQQPIGHSGSSCTLCSFQDLDVPPFLPVDYSSAGQGSNFVEDSRIPDSNAAASGVIHPGTQISAAVPYNPSLEVFDPFISPYLLRSSFDCSLPLAPSSDAAATSILSDPFLDMMQPGHLFHYFNGRNV